MKSLPYEARTKNVGAKDFCRWCANDGYVVVALRAAEPMAPLPQCKPVGEYEEMAPCPYCQAGYREEFPTPASDNSKPVTAPWGPDGFWRGQDLVDLVPLYPSGGVLLSREENRQKWRDEIGPLIVGRQLPA